MPKPARKKVLRMLVGENATPILQRGCRLLLRLVRGQHPRHAGDAVETLKAEGVRNRDVFVANTKVEVETRRTRQASVDAGVVVPLLPLKTVLPNAREPKTLGDWSIRNAWRLLKLYVPNPRQV